MSKTRKRLNAHAASVKPTKQTRFEVQSRRKRSKKPKAPKVPKLPPDLRRFKPQKPYDVSLLREWKNAKEPSDRDMIERLIRDRVSHYRAARDFARNS